MYIEVRGKCYAVAELADEWKVDLSAGKVSAAVKVSKELCGTLEELRAYLEESDGLLSGVWRND